MPHDLSLPRLHTLRSDEGIMQHNELMDLVTKLSDRVVALETDLRQTKKVRANIVVSNDEDDAEDSSKQGRKIDEIDQDPDITLGQHDVEIQGTVTIAGASISTASPLRVSTVEDISTTETLVYIRKSAAKDKGKAKMDESKPEKTKTKLQQKQERVGYEPIVRLQEQLDEEERKRIARRDAEEELDQGSSKRQKTGENSEPVEESKEKEEDELSQDKLHQLMIIVPEEGLNVEALQTKYLIIDWEIYTEDSRMYWKIIRVDPTEDKEIELWVELKRLFKHDVDDELWKSQKHVHDITWRLYDTCGVHHVSIKDGIDIYMLVEKEYPWSRGVLT
ncbi:hypothetical protein Tco_1140060 [Tanacetum coccineum]